MSFRFDRAIIAFTVAFAAALCAVAQELPSRTYSGSLSRLVRPSAPGRLEAVDSRFLRILPPLSDEERNPPAPSRLPVIGVRRNIGADVFNAGGVRTLAGGEQVWQLTIRSPEAKAIRVHFREFNAGNGHVWIYDSSGRGGSRVKSAGPWTGQGIFGDGEFWSPGVWSDSVTIEYVPAAGAVLTAVPPFTVDAIAHRWAATTPPIRPADDAASCNLDVTCYKDYADIARSSVTYDFMASDTAFASCSGAIIGTRSGSLLPYLLTANHCVSTDKQARTVDVLFLYQTAKCNDADADWEMVQFGSGAGYIAGAGMSQGDYTLLLLTDPVPPGVTFAGWTTDEPAIGESTTSLHHPQSSWSKITFGHRTADLTLRIEGAVAYSYDFYQILADQGVIEPGSSGGPLLNHKLQVVGTATAADNPPGGNVCVGKQAAVYGRFSVAYSAFKKYLEDTAPSNLQVSASRLSFSIDNGQLTSAPTQTFTVSTSSSTAVAFSVISGDAWAVPSATSGTVSAGKPAKFTVTADPRAFGARNSLSTQIRVSVPTMAPVLLAVQLDVTFHAVVTAVINPDPVYQSTPDVDGNQWTYKVVLTETAGTATQLKTFKIAGTDKSAQIAALFGSADIPANGTLTATMREKDVAVPGNRQYDFGGTDPVTGRTWTASASGTFLAAAPKPIAVFPHIAADSQWQTDIALQNPGASAVAFTLTFHADGGGPATLDTIGSVSQVSDTIPALGSRFYRITAVAGSGAWADLNAAAPLSGVAVFRRQAPDGNYYEGGVPLSAPSTGFIISFDATQFSKDNPLLNGIAIMNADSSIQGIVTCHAYDSDGHQLGQTLKPQPLAPFGHTSFILQWTEPFETALKNSRGLLSCASNTPIAAIGVRVLGFAVSALPVSTVP